jgi:hypothetical protein
LTLMSLEKRAFVWKLIYFYVFLIMKI